MGNCAGIGVTPDVIAGPRTGPDAEQTAGDGARKKGCHPARVTRVLTKSRKRGHLAVL